MLEDSFATCSYFSIILAPSRQLATLTAIMIWLIIGCFDAVCHMFPFPNHWLHLIRVLPCRSASAYHLFDVLSWVTLGNIWWIWMHTIALEIAGVIHVISHYHHLLSAKAGIIIDDVIHAHLRSHHTIICSVFCILDSSEIHDLSYHHQSSAEVLMIASLPI